MLDFLRYLADRRDLLQPQAETHINIVLVSLICAAAIGIALGIVASRYRLASSLVLAVTGALLTVPSFALFGILAIWFGIGDEPVTAGLVLYALLPIARNTELGIRSVDSAVLESARGMGMTSRQALLGIELPLAVPLIVGGLRQSAVMIVAIATVGAAVGSNNLGQPIFAGIRGSDSYAILSGALPVALIGLGLDGLLLGVETMLGRRALGSPS